jgi:hypothetical protein
MSKIRYRRDLYKLFKTPGMAAEIGVAEGNNAEDMLRWMIGGEAADGSPRRAAISKLFLVDRWRTVQTQKGDAAMDQAWHDKNFAQVEKRIKPYTGRTEILRGNSVHMAMEVDDASLFLVYIDGDHSYEGCFNDLRAWGPKVKRGGYIACHDFMNPSYGVKQAVMDFCADNFKIHYLPEDKPDDAGCYFQII